MLHDGEIQKLSKTNFFNGRSLIYAEELSGPEYLEDTSLRLNINNETYHEADLSLDFVGITNSTQPFESSLSGFIGIGPYTMADSDQDQRKSFMIQLQEQKLIDHHIISFFVRSQNDNLSHIKFGSWDVENTDGNPITLRTVDTKTWKVECRGIKLPGDNKEVYNLRFIDLDPAYPDVYAPDNDWKVITAYLS